MTARVPTGSPLIGRIEGPVAVTAVLVAASLLAVSHIYLTIPLVPAVADEYGTAPATAAWIGGVFGLAMAVGNLLFPTLSDHVDPRRVMMWGIIGVAVADVVAGLAPSFSALIGARAVQGFLTSAIAPVALAYLPRVVPERVRAAALAVLTSCFLLAGIAGQAWSLLVEPSQGWRGAMWCAAPLLAVAAALLSKLPETPRPATPRSFGGVIGTLAGMLRRPQILIAYTAAFSFLLTFVGMYAALQSSGTDLGAGDPVTGLLLRLPGLPGVVLGWFAGSFITRWGPHRTGAVAFLISASGLGIEAAGGPLWITLAGSGVFIAGLAVAVPSAIIVVGIASGPARGAAMAGYSFFIGVGASIGPLVATPLAEAGFGLTCAVLAGVLLVPAAAFAVGARLGVPNPSDGTENKEDAPARVAA